jgi:hypothetical protein
VRGGASISTVDRRTGTYRSSQRPHTPRRPVPRHPHPHNQVTSPRACATTRRVTHTVIDMATPEGAPTTTPTFAVVRRGYDPAQVAQHLNHVEAVTSSLAADRAAAVEQAAHLSRQLASCRKEIDAAHSEIERLCSETRALAGPPDTVAGMSERIQLMLRLAKDEFAGMRACAAAQAAAHAADIIAAVDAEAGDVGFGFDEEELRGPRDESELEQWRRTAADERARLDEEAATRRAAEEEEFRRVLALRCREAMVQVAKMQTEAMRTARRLIDEADERARSVLAAARESVRRTIDDAQREVDDLHELRERLAGQLDTSRRLLNAAMPDIRVDRVAATNGAAKNGAGTNGSGTNGSGPSVTPTEPQAASTRADVRAAEPQAGSPNGQQADSHTEQQADTSTLPQPAESSPTAQAAESGATGTPVEHDEGEAPVATATAKPALPAVAVLPVSPGWPVPSSSVEPQAGAPDEPPTRPVALGVGSEHDATQAHSVRIPARDVWSSSDVPAPSRIPFEEQDTQIAAPRRYP